MDEDYKEMNYTIIINIEIKKYAENKLKIKLSYIFFYFEIINILLKKWN